MPNDQEYRAPADAHVGKVRLAVSSLAHSAAFYRDVIGLTPLGTEDGIGRFGAGETVLLELQELPGLKPLGRQHRLGLYHFAVLLPTRKDLANFVIHSQQIGAPFGASDHLASEATYFVDPDGLTVEVYADRPRDQWQYKGKEVVLAIDPLDYEDLLPHAHGPWTGAPQGTTIGHMHFYVGNLEQAKQFYCQGLGLDVMSHIPGALFVSAGGYHHHVGLNTWAAGSPLAGPEDPRILSWEWVLPAQKDVSAAAQSLAAIGARSFAEDAFADAWNIPIRLKASSP